MEDQLDRAIDAVAREMTNVDAPASTRAEVLARVVHDRTRAGMGLPRWAWAGAAAVIILAGAAGLWLVRGSGGTNSEPAFARADTKPSSLQPSPSASAARPTHTGASAATADDPARRPRSTIAQAVAPPVPAGLPDDSGPAPLAAPGPIAIVPLEPDAIDISEMAVVPLGDIQPITVTTAGPGSAEPQRRDER